MKRLNLVPQDYSIELEEAKKVVSDLYGVSRGTSVIDLLNETNLEEIENGIKQLNEISNRTWLISAIALYSTIFSQDIYKQSGLEWQEYIKESRARLGMDSRDVSEQLSSARFFIKYHKRLIEEGWNPNKPMRSMARAEYALELSGDINSVIKHLAKDSWADFKGWYEQYKLPSANIPPSKYKVDKNKITYSKGIIKIGGERALVIGDNLEDNDKHKLESYMKELAKALKEGQEVAIIGVKDKTEANQLLKMRDDKRLGN